MINRFRAVAIAVALLPPGSVASAQTPPLPPPTAAVLAPAGSPRWDLAGHVAYFTLNKSGLSADWNDWSDTAAAGASAGYYLKPHLKLEVDVFASGRGDVYSEHSFSVPNSQVPIWFQRRHVFQTTGIGTGLRYQLFQNRWVHPFAGVGIEGARERETTESADPTLPFRLPSAPVITAGGTTVSWLARAYVEAGAKFYVAENAFIRTDLRSAFDGRGVAAVTWRTGLGFDF
jgi:hypothetical protein